MPTTKRPDSNECAAYHSGYISLVPDGDIVDFLTIQGKKIPNFIRSIPPEKADIIHQPYSWTVRQVLEHCMDAERVFGYRVLRFSTGDRTDLPGWNENDYAASGYGPNAGLNELAEEFSALRGAIVCQTKRLSAEAWERSGTADGRGVSVRTLIWLMAGHWLHHQAILLKRLILD